MLTPEQQADIDELRSNPAETFRATVPALEKILYTPFPKLDHGFLRIIDYMGDDAAIVQAARVSYGKGTKVTQNDRGLIRYLMRHRHSSPFEMCELKIHVKLPIFVARQWIRHRTANVNEMSARYSIMDNEFYVPSAEHLAQQSKDNKQGRDEVLSAEQASDVMDILKKEALNDYDVYSLLHNDQGDGTPINPENPMLARELARMGLGTNFYTQWYWKVDLHNLFHFLSLRADSHAQFEIRTYAETLCDIVEQWVPHAYGAFHDFRVRGAFFSGSEMDVLRDVMGTLGETAEARGVLAKNLKARGVSNRDIKGFLTQFGLQKKSNN